MTTYGMTPEAYRAKWSLKPDYPMVAPSYARKRQELAVKFGPWTQAGPSPARAPTKGKEVTVQGSRLSVNTLNEGTPATMAPPCARPLCAMSGPEHDQRPCPLCASSGQALDEGPRWRACIAHVT